MFPKTILTLCLLTLFGCNSEEGLNCFQAAGTTVREEFAVADFTKVTVYERTQLVIKQGPVQKVEIETGKNLLNDIEVTVTGDRLEIRNTNGCNLVREYGLTTAYITVPNVTEIRNSTGLDVRSDGVLNFPNLLLLSEDIEIEDQFHIDGDFYLNLNTENLEIIASGLSKFYLGGTVNAATFVIDSGDARIEAAGLTVNHLEVFHRGTNEMIVNPQNSIKGKITGLGNVIAKNRPETVQVETPYRGRLIFD
ncbi:MAG: head GIN domain-containing protein [Marinirhabdus sp.]